MKLSLIICTYNRATFLPVNLHSLVSQLVYSDQTEVLIIDNNSTDSTKNVASEFVSFYSNVSYYFEPRLGLSHARNRGVKEAKGEWLCYIDDDAKLHPNYIERALWAIENYDFDCFGGMYYAWYPFGKPKWIDNDFGTKISLRETVGPVNEPELSGGNFLIKKEVLEKAGGFPLEFGMTGNKIGYGEEDYLQIKLLEMSYKLGFDPELKIDHAVLPHKLKLSWHLKSWYALGRDGQRYSRKYNAIEILFFTFRSTLGGILKLPFCLGEWVILRDYYWQNLIWDVASPVLFRFGQIKGALS